MDFKFNLFLRTDRRRCPLKRQLSLTQLERNRLPIRQSVWTLPLAGQTAFLPILPILPILGRPILLGRSLLATHGSLAICIKPKAYVTLHGACHVWHVVCYNYQVACCIGLAVARPVARPVACGIMACRVVKIHAAPALPTRALHRT
jgi:hypothetical protein